MAYPTDANIYGYVSNAANAGADPEDVYAFAAAKGRLPTSNIELNGWTTSAYGSSAFPVVDKAYKQAYIIENRGGPPNQNAFWAFGIAQGWFGPNDQATGLTPPVGYGYDAATGQGAASTSTTAVAPAAATGFDFMASVQQNPLIWGGGALVGVFLISQLFKGGRR